MIFIVGWICLNFENLSNLLIKEENFVILGDNNSIMMTLNKVLEHLQHLSLVLTVLEIFSFFPNHAPRKYVNESKTHSIEYIESVIPHVVIYPEPCSSK